MPIDPEQGIFKLEKKKYQSLFSGAGRYGFWTRFFQWANSQNAANCFEWFTDLNSIHPHVYEDTARLVEAMGVSRPSRQPQKPGQTNGGRKPLGSYSGPWETMGYS